MRERVVQSDNLPGLVNPPGKATFGSNQMQACTVAAGQTRRTHSQVERHGATDPTVAVGEREEDPSSQQNLE